MQPESKITRLNIVVENECIEIAKAIYDMQCAGGSPEAVRDQLRQFAKAIIQQVKDDRP